MAAVDIQVSILGPLRVHAGGMPVTVPGPRCAVVLTALALAAGRTVTVESLIDDVWADDDELPQFATASLHNLVARLRRVVGADAIRTVSAGYLLDVDPEQVDVLRFRRLVGDAARSEPGKSRVLLSEALSLWDGEPLAGIASERLRRDVAPALAEELVAAAERRIDLDLAAGQHENLIAELRELVGRYPLRETLWRQLIVALDAAGRHADALNAYHDVRKELRERLGVEPGAELRGLYQLLLTERAGDAPGESPSPMRLRAGRNDLPADTADFTGRGQELARLLTTATGSADGGAGPGAVTICLIDGMAGIGKTTLAVRLAHRLVDSFPDARLFIDLRGHTPGHEPMDPAAALGELLRALGLSGELLPEGLAERAALWRAELAGRRVLVVLDNAASADQVRPLIPGSAGCLAIVTSRRRIADLDGAHVVSLDALPQQDASALFAAIAGADRCAAEPDALAVVLETCGYLPLALRVAAARLRSRPAWSIRYLADRLADEQHRLAELTVGQRSVCATFGLSYEQLTPTQQRMFRLLGLHPGTFADAHLAAGLVGVGVREARAQLEDLVDAHLLQQPTAGHYRFHDLLRHYARTMLERDETADARDEAVGRMLDYYRDATDHVRRYFAITNASTDTGSDETPNSALAGGRELPTFETDWQALAWCDEQRANLLAIIGYAKDNAHDEHLSSMLNAIWWFLRMRGHLAEWIDAQRSAVQSAERRGDEQTAGDMNRLLGAALWEFERYTEAMSHYRRAIELYTATGDVRSRARTLSHLASACCRFGQYEEALELLEQALRDNHSRDAHIEGSILLGFACVYQAIGRHAEALGPARESLVLFERVRDFLAQGQAHSLLGRVLGSSGSADEALGHHREALSLIRACDARAIEAESLNDLGDTLFTLGRLEQAREQYEAGLALAAQLNLSYEQTRARDGIARTLADGSGSASSDSASSDRASDPVLLAEPGVQTDR